MGSNDASSPNINGNAWLLTYNRLNFLAVHPKKKLSDRELEQSNTTALLKHLADVPETDIVSIALPDVPEGPFMRMPIELWFTIFGRLPLETLGTLAQTCKRFAFVAADIIQKRYNMDYLLALKMVHLLGSIVRPLPENTSNFFPHRLAVAVDTARVATRLKALLLEVEKSIKTGLLEQWQKTILAQQGEQLPEKTRWKILYEYGCAGERVYSITRDAVNKIPMQMDQKQCEILATALHAVMNYLARNNELFKEVEDNTKKVLKRASIY